MLGYCYDALVDRLTQSVWLRGDGQWPSWRLAFHWDDNGIQIATDEDGDHYTLDVMRGQGGHVVHLFLNWGRRMRRMSFSSVSAGWSELERWLEHPAVVFMEEDL